MKYKPGTKWNIYPTAEEELKRHQEWFAEFEKKMDADPEIGRRLMIDAGIWDENGQPTEKYRAPEQS